MQGFTKVLEDKVTQPVCGGGLPGSEIIQSVTRESGREFLIDINPDLVKSLACEFG
jgi:hypothetical protein